MSERSGARLAGMTAARGAAALLALTAAGKIESAQAAPTPDHSSIIQRTNRELTSLYEEIAVLAQKEYLPGAQARRVQVRDGRQVRLSLAYRDGTQKGEPLYDQLVMWRRKGERIPYRTLLKFGSHTLRFSNDEAPAQGTADLKYFDKPIADLEVTINDVNDPQNSSKNSLPQNMPEGFEYNRSEAAINKVVSVAGNMMAAAADALRN